MNFNKFNLYLCDMVFQYMMRKLIHLLLILAVSLPLCAQKDCSFTHYSTEDGLSQNTVMSMLQDQKGNLWFATWDGINRFNGYSFMVYKARQGNSISLINNRVDRFAEDSEGCLWLQTYDNRAHRFDPRTETFMQVPAAGEDGSALNVSTIHTLPNGTVWLFAEEGAIRVTTNIKTQKPTSYVYSSKSETLPTTHMYKVHLDSEGNEWMLTDNGLGKIAPGKHTPVTYFVKAKDQQDDVQSFYSVQEQPDEICFGSGKGRIWRYNKKDGQFRLLELPTSAPVVGISRVSDNQVVVSTSTDGFFLYNLKTGDKTHYTPLLHKELPLKPILSAYVDRASEVWFEQEEPGVVAHFNPKTGVLKREQLKTEPVSSDRSRPAFHIHEDINGYLWVHPYGGGFSYFDRKANALVPFYDELGTRDWKFSNKIHSAFSDKQGNLWISSHSKGLEKVTFRTVQFSLLTPAPESPESLGNEVRALCEDKDKNLWVGLKDGKIRVYDQHRVYKGYLTESGTVSTTGIPMQGTAYYLMEDSKGIMWIATKGDGLVRAQRTSATALSFKLTRYTYSDKDTYSLSNDNVYCVYEDHHGRIWVATFANGINYLTYDKDGKALFISHRNNLKGYPINPCYRARFITSDNNGRLWVGTTAGAVAFDEDFTNPEDVVFHHFARIPDDPESLSNNDVHWITPTYNKELFLGTFGGGLNKLIAINEDGTGDFKSYSVFDGLSSDVVLSIREDKKHNLWLGTENGLSKFDPAAETFDNYSYRSISFRVRFSEAASAVLSSGEMAFGASSGTLFFNPDSVRKSSYVPPIVFSNLVIANKNVEPGKESILKMGLDDTRKLELSHKENLFTIQYAALDFTNPGNVQYAYMLEGLDDHWSYVDKLRSATFTSLPKGHYVFKVRSTNSDGVWVDNERSLDIVVLPSFWETSFAYFLYVLFIVLFILVAVYILFTIYRLKHEVSVEQQVSDIKLRFFTDISHELRTPLTLIAGPVEHVLKNSRLSDETREQLVVVERNTNRMLRLVNQILDFRKIQNKKMKMQVQRLDIVAFVRRIMESFESMAEEHAIDFLLESEKSELYLWVDADKFEKIVFNLLSNAFKYTPNGKLISIFIREDEETISIGVQDQGIGIAENRKKSLFVRFENLVDKNLFNQGSTGIGLSLVKELVEMHGATISVESKLGEGSCFQVDFLKGKEHYDKTVEYILDDSTVFGEPAQDTPVIQEQVTELGAADTGLPETEDEDTTQKEVMLLVEDNQELRFFLRSIFGQTYRVVEAANGQEGWHKALSFVPDIIISDVMMPEKDGIELTKELRAEITTSHIPIVLLTAKTAIESKLEGLEYGADDYITKPFSATYLKARVENLLAQRRKLQNFYRDNLMNHVVISHTAGIPTPEENIEESEQGVANEEPQQPMSPHDRKFMEKLVELMEKNMDNGDLIVDSLVRELAVSRSVFFKKLKTLTGLAPIEFIKEMRITRAAQLIETGEFNMTQISYMVGINDPRYFSKCFKAKYGMTPTEYRDNLGRK